MLKGKQNIKKTIWAHCVVRNEENFIWFAIMSVIDHVDKVLIYDLGSTDKTVEIIKTIKNKKIVLRKFPANHDMLVHADMRQKMLDETKSDWVFLLDGDEIWLEDSIKKIVNTIRTDDEAECIVVPNYMLLGDVYHYQEDLGGMYHIAGKKGHYNMRAFNRRIPGLHIEIHPNEKGLMRESFYDNKGGLIYERSPKRTLLLDAPYMHATHLRRSSKDEEVVERKIRFKYELGIKFAQEFKFPQSFYLELPSIVKSPWEKPNFLYQLLALIQTPLKKIKRRIKIG